MTRFRSVNGKIFATQRKNATQRNIFVFRKMEQTGRKTTPLSLGSFLTHLGPAAPLWSYMFQYKLEQSASYVFIICIERFMAKLEQHYLNGSKMSLLFSSKSAE